MNIYQRINEVRKTVGFVVKDKTVSAGAGGTYKAVTHDQVTGILRDAMIQHGVVFFPNLESSVMNPPMVNVDGTQSKQSRYDATYTFTFVNADDPEDRFSVKMEAQAMDNGDKAPGKALSYAVKYALLKIFMLETGENEEARYQKGDVDIPGNVEMIHKSETFDELKESYKVAVEIALDSADKAAIKAFSAARDKRKQELLKENK